MVTVQVEERNNRTEQGALSLWRSHYPDPLFSGSPTVAPSGRFARSDRPKNAKRAEDVSMEKRKYGTWQRLSDSTRHLVETCENAKYSLRKHGESIALDFIKEG